MALTPDRKCVVVPSIAARSSAIVGCRTITAGMGVKRNTAVRNPNAR